MKRKYYNKTEWKKKIHAKTKPKLLQTILKSKTIKKNIYKNPT